MAAAVTITLPESMTREVPVMAQRLVDRMHHLLERNTDGALDAMEKDELAALVNMAEFAQVIASALHQVAT